MVECRAFEVRAQELFFEGLVRGTPHLGVGQEAVAAGVAAAMRDADYTFATYRGHNLAPWSGDGLFYPCVTQNNVPGSVPLKPTTPFQYAVLHDLFTIL